MYIFVIEIYIWCITMATVKSVKYDDDGGKTVLFSKTTNVTEHDNQTGAHRGCSGSITVSRLSLWRIFWNKTKHFNNRIICCVITDYLQTGRRECLAFGIRVCRSSCTSLQTVGTDRDGETETERQSVTTALWTGAEPSRENSEQCQQLLKIVLRSVKSQHLSMYQIMTTMSLCCGGSV